MDRSGRGAGAILNQDLTANSATNPSRRGDTVVIYGTGGGALPGAVDGRLAQAPFPSLSGVTVRVGGVAAEVTYAGPAPGLVAGVLQINAIVPAGASSGAAIPIDVMIAGATSQSGVTVAIQ
jgi:trimeric autotransporter adhesin